jgi:exonuclease III
MRVMSINAWALPRPFSYEPYRRLKMMAERIKKESPDVVCFQEVWLKRYVRFLKKNLEEYYFSASKKGVISNVSGLLILSKNKPKNCWFTRLPSIGGRIDERFGRKGILEIEIKLDKKTITIINTHLYARSCDDEYKHIKEHLRFLKKVLNKKTNLIFVGDLNIVRKEFREWNKGYLLWCNTKKGTIDSKNPYRGHNKIVHYVPEGNLIDYIAIKSDNKRAKIKTKVLNSTYFSDHQPLLSEIKL